MVTFPTWIWDCDVTVMKSCPVPGQLSFILGFYLSVLLLQLIEITSFICINRIKEKEKGKFRQASNRCKRCLEAVKLPYINKTKEFDIPVPFNVSYVLPPASDKTNFLWKYFLRFPILMIHVSLYLLFLPELKWNCIIFF